MEVKQYTYKNKEEINNIYIHDSYFSNININMNNKKIYATLEGEYLKNKACSLIFENIIHCEFSRIELWGIGESRILEIYVDEENSVKKYIEDKIKKEQDEGTNICEFKQDINKFITIGILICTGDIISITCENMIIIDE